MEVFNRFAAQIRLHRDQAIGPMGPWVEVMPSVLSGWFVLQAGFQKHLLEGLGI